MNKHKGFTIVELVIVIVIIGILAAITVVSYNGIQAHARNTRMSAAARQTKNILQSYVLLHGAIPTNIAAIDDSSWFELCIGDAADYPATPQIPAGKCRSSDANPVDAAASTALKKMGSISSGAHDAGMIVPVKVDASTTVYVRGTIAAFKRNGSTFESYLYYYLQGDSPCSTASTSKFYGNGMTTCRVDIPGLAFAQKV